MTSRFYVYAFLRKDNTPYYVGKGTGKRAYSKNRVIKPPKDRKRIVFLRKGLSEADAFKWERFYIKHYGRIDLGTGILRNLTDGGEGTSNPSEETREKFRERGKRFAEKFVQASKLKSQRAVELTCMESGSVFLFDCASDAARIKNLSIKCLHAVCVGKQLSTGGFLARYWSPGLDNWGEGLFHLVEEVRQRQKTHWRGGSEALKVHNLKRRKPVELTRISDSEVFVFEHLRQASEVTGLDRKSLLRVCQGKSQSTGGFLARFWSPDLQDWGKGLLDQVKEIKQRKKIETTRIIDGEVIIFDSLTEASQALNLTCDNLNEVCIGKQYTAGGFLARYWSPDLDDWGEGLFHKVEVIEQMKKESYKRTGRATKLRFQKATELIRISDGAVIIYDCLSDAARDLKLDPSHLSKVCRGKLKSTGGYTARFV